MVRLNLLAGRFSFGGHEASVVTDLIPQRGGRFTHIQITVLKTWSGRLKTAARKVYPWREMEERNG